uniref:NADH-ubiquinone oxidoreductase chain 3 n=1 Tax=Amblyomma americanum TaxID=6943 RepID=Q3LV60_AMBAM|nr:NADH dehydrogenase subunit 3 [Amblyomma americanum]
MYFQFMFYLLFLVEKNLKSKEKLSPFECGLDPFSLSRVPFSLKTQPTFSCFVSVHIQLIAHLQYPPSVNSTHFLPLITVTPTQFNYLLRPLIQKKTIPYRLLLPNSHPAYFLPPPSPP